MPHRRLRGSAGRPGARHRPQGRGRRPPGRARAHRRRRLRHRRHLQPRQRLALRGRGPRGRAGDRVLEARQHVLAGHRRAADPAGHAARARVRRPGRGRRDRRGRVDRSTRPASTSSRSRGCGPRSAGTEILHGIDLTVSSGEVHAVMGPNGAGKSTLSGVVMGRPGYEVLGGSVTLDGEDVLAMAPWERAVAGLYLAMQYPTEVPGVRLDAVLTEALRRPGPWTRPTSVATLRGRGRADRLRRALPGTAAQRRPVRRREEAQRDAAARGAGRRGSPSSTSSTPASTSTRCAPAPAASRRRRTRTASACWPSPTTTACSTS